uniref:Uncharacterized protein n=1 Tax=Plectus sambesii TaxID=2011161 RepID=A0A914W073_9BILA
MFYYVGDGTKTTAGTGLYIPASLAFIQVHTLNYTDNDDSTDYDISDDDDDGIYDESKSGVGNKTTASMSTSPHRWRSPYYTCPREWLRSR